jgi:hypothetical protein
VAAPIQTLFPVLNERVGVEYPLPALVQGLARPVFTRTGENHGCAVPATQQNALLGAWRLKLDLRLARLSR